MFSLAYPRYLVLNNIQYFIGQEFKEIVFQINTIKPGVVQNRYSLHKINGFIIASNQNNNNDIPQYPVKWFQFCIFVDVDRKLLHFTNEISENNLLWIFSHNLIQKVTTWQQLVLPCIWLIDIRCSRNSGEMCAKPLSIAIAYCLQRRWHDRR